MTKYKSSIKFKIRYLYLGSGLLCIVLLGIIFFGNKTLIEGTENRIWLGQALEIVNQVRVVELSLNELDVMQRVQALSEQDFEQKDLLKKISDTLNHLVGLENKLHHNREQVLRSRYVQRLMKSLLELCAQDVSRVNKNGFRFNDVTGKEKWILDESRRVIYEMIVEERKLLIRSQGKLEKNERYLQKIILVGGSLSIFTIIISIVIVSGEFKRRSKIQAELNKTSQIQKAILESASMAIFASDEKGKITHFNPAAEKLLGYKEDEVLGKSPVIFHRADEVAKMAQVLFEQYSERVPVGHDVFSYRALKGIISSDQWTFVRKNGSQVRVILSISLFKGLDHEACGYIGVAYDITEQIQFEEAIITAKEAALAATKAKSEFLANMSHEIRTPMNAIVGMAELLNETKLDDEQKRYVDIFRGAGESLLNIINDILDISKIEAGHFELDYAPFMLSQVITKAKGIIAQQAHKKQLEFVVDIDPDFSDYFIGDANRIRQILLNLLGNSVKFTKRGEVLLRVQTGPTKNNKQEIIFEILDSGIGMSEEQLQSLFERFKQADSSITREYGGTGLGLSITRHLVEKMYGSIDVKSTQGVGTRFTVKIEVDIDTEKKLVDQSLNLNNLNVLIVDDCKANRLILKKILEGFGAKTSEAIDGESALGLIEKGENADFDLILLDCNMPGMDGFTVAEKAVQITKMKKPLLMMLTSDHRPGDLSRSRELGFKSYLVKPILKHELLQAINALLHDEGDQLIESLEIVSAPQDIRTPLLKILLVDDNEENRLIVKTFLKSHPWEITEAKNGHEALSYIFENEFDVILMDMQMPLMDGYTAIQKMRVFEHEVNRARVPVVALTAYALKEEVDRAFKSGCDDYLTKPVSKQSLISTIETHIRSKIVIDKELQDLIPGYLENRKAELIELNRLLSTHQISEIGAIGHKLKGSAGSYGLTRLTDIGGVLEMNAKVNGTKEISNALKEYKKFLEEIKITYK